MFKKWTALFLLFFTLSIQAKQLDIFVKEMNCQLCVYLVNKELRNIEGVQTTKADMKNRIVKVEADDNLDPQILLNTLAEKLHYHAELILQ